MADEQGLRWENGRRKLSDLRPQEDNPRHIDKDSVERLRTSWDDYGQVETLAVGPDGSIYNGHQRYYVLLDRHGPDYEVDVRVASRSLSRREWQRLTVFLHEGAVGDWDFDGLANWDGVDVGDLMDWGFDPASLGIEDWGKEEPQADPGAQIDKAAELQEKWGADLGQIWEIGRHRMMCGDSTDQASAAGVMNGAKFRCMWTDPPYGVSYGEKNRYLQSIGRADKLLGDIENDQLRPAALSELLIAAFSVAAVHGEPGAVAYVASPAGSLLPIFIQAMNDSGFNYRHQLIWLNNQLVFGRADYMYKHESVLYGWLQTGAHFFEARTNNCSVFEIDRPRASKLHPTMKPIELVAAMIENSSNQGEIVFDPFLGSASTIVACEQIGRIGRGIEIEPKYIAVSLERLAGMGLEPKLVGEV